MSVGTAIILSVLAAILSPVILIAAIILFIVLLSLVLAPVQFFVLLSEGFKEEGGIRKVKKRQKRSNSGK